MCKCRRWLLALVVSSVVPCAASAGPFDLVSAEKNSPAAGKKSTNGAKAKSQNQIVAEQVAKELKAAQLQGYNIQIEYSNGVVRLNGQISDPRQKALASKVAARVRGVVRVENQLTQLPATVAGQRSETGQSQRPALLKPTQSSFLSKKSAAETAQPADNSVTSQLARLWQVRQTAAQEPPKLLPPSTPKSAPIARPSALLPGLKKKPNNQQVADEIASSLRSAKLSGYDIGVRVENGVATLSGTVANPGQRARAEEVVSQVSGVDRVNNELQFGASPAQSLANQMPGVRPAHLQTMEQPHPQQTAARSKPYAIPVPVANRSMPPQWQMAQAGQPPMPPTGPAGPNGPSIPPSYGPGPGGPGIPAPPSYGHPGQGASHTVYNMPHLPNYAWPAYAAYPNSAQVSYPTEYSASAWPYIGPFYPYPQIPLGWRKVQLEWDDGYWNLNFNPRTDKWFWFVNPKYW